MDTLDREKDEQWVLEPVKPETLLEAGTTEARGRRPRCLGQAGKNRRRRKTSGGEGARTGRVRAAGGALRTSPTHTVTGSQLMRWPATHTAGSVTTFSSPFNIAE